MGEWAIFVAVGGFLLSHLGLAVWFASKMKTEVSHMREDVTEATAAIKEMSHLQTRITLLEQRIERAELDIREGLKAALARHE